MRIISKDPTKRGDFSNIVLHQINSTCTKIKEIEIQRFVNQSPVELLLLLLQSLAGEKALERTPKSHATDVGQIPTWSQSPLDYSEWSLNCSLSSPLVVGSTQCLSEEQKTSGSCNIWNLKANNV